MIPCLAVHTADLSHVKPGKVDAAAGRAAYDFLCAAIDLTLAGEADGIVTAPLHKEGLRAAGLPYPGHTEILAQRTGTRHFAMLLFVAQASRHPPFPPSTGGSSSPRQRGGQGGWRDACATRTDGLGVAHVTLHMALRDVFRHLTTEAVLDKIHLLDGIMPRLLGRPARLGVAALNPHGSDGGLFGDEEAAIIQPAVAMAQGEGINVTGPWPTDTLFVRRGVASLTAWWRCTTIRGASLSSCWAARASQHQCRPAISPDKRSPRNCLRHRRSRHCRCERPGGSSPDRLPVDYKVVFSFQFSPPLPPRHRGGSLQLTRTQVCR